MPDIRPSQYLVAPTGYDELVHTDKDAWRLTIVLVDSENDRWGVKRFSYRLNRNTMEWSYEPIPSERTDQWREDHQFTYEEAANAALALVDDLVVNGMTAQEASDYVAARLKKERQTNG